MKNFGEKILNLRKQKGLSQEQLATDLFISQSSVSNYESGLTKPDVDVLQKMADYFQVPVTYFLLTVETVFYSNENNGSNIGNFNNITSTLLSEKLIALYEKRIKDLEEEIRKLKNK